MAYRALTGIVPPRAAERARDDRMAPLHTLAGSRCSARFASAIDPPLPFSPSAVRATMPTSVHWPAGSMPPSRCQLPRLSAGMDRFIDDVVATVDALSACKHRRRRLGLSFHEWKLC